MANARKAVCEQKSFQAYEPHRIFPHERDKTFRSRRVSTDTSYDPDPTDI